MEQNSTFIQAFEAFVAAKEASQAAEGKLSTCLSIYINILKKNKLSTIYIKYVIKSIKGNNNNISFSSININNIFIK